MDFFDNRYFYINKFFLSCIGQWPYHSPVRNRSIQFVIIIALLICLMTTVTGFLKAWGDLDDMVECLPTIFTALGCLVYTIVYVAKERKVKKLFNQIKDDWQLWSSGEERYILSNHANHGRMYTILYTGCVTGTLVTYMMMSVTPQILDIFHPLNESRPKKLPYQVYYFVNYSDEYFYWIISHILFNAISQMCILIGSESILAVFTEHACGVFKVIGYQLRKMKNFEEDKKSQKEDAKRVTYSAVVFCIEQHNRAIEFCNIIESLFCPCFFFIMALNAILISASLIQVVVNLDKIDIAVRFGAFTGASVAHLFLNSLPAQRLMDYSVSLADNVYDGMWYQMPVKIRKLLLLIMMRSSVPCKLTAGKMLDLTLKNVCLILQASFSYFTLLSSMRT